MLWLGLSLLNVEALACTGSQIVSGTNYSIDQYTYCNFNVSTLGAFNISGGTTGKQVVFNNSNITLEGINAPQSSNVSFINTTLIPASNTKNITYSISFGDIYSFINSVAFKLANVFNSNINAGSQFYALNTTFSNSSGGIFKPNNGQLNLESIYITLYTYTGANLIQHFGSNFSLRNSRIEGDNTQAYNANGANFFNGNGGALNISFIGNNFTNWHEPVIYLNKGIGGGNDIVYIQGNLFYRTGEAMYLNSGVNNTHFNNNTIIGDSNGFCFQTNNDNYNIEIANNTCSNKTRGMYMFTSHNIYLYGNNLTAIWDLSHAGQTFDRTNDSITNMTSCQGVNRACILSSENNNVSSYNTRSIWNQSINNGTPNNGAYVEIWEGSGSNYKDSGSQGTCGDYCWNLFPSSVVASMPCENTTLENGRGNVTGINYQWPACIAIRENNGNTVNRGCGYTQINNMVCDFSLRGNQSIASGIRLESAYATQIFGGSQNNTDRIIWINTTSNNTRIVNFTFGSNFTQSQLYMQGGSFATVINGFQLNSSNITIANDVINTTTAFVGYNVTIQLNWSNGTPVSAPVQFTFTSYDISKSNFNLLNSSTDANGRNATEMPSYLKNETGEYNFTITANTTYNGKKASTIINRIGGSSLNIQLLANTPLVNITCWNEDRSTGCYNNSIMLAQSYLNVSELSKGNMTIFSIKNGVTSTMTSKLNDRLLLAHFDTDLNTSDNEAPTAAFTGTGVLGYFGNGINASVGQLTYSSSNNILADSGSYSSMLAPYFGIGNDSLTHIIFRWQLQQFVTNNEIFCYQKNDNTLKCEFYNSSGALAQVLISNMTQNAPYFGLRYSQWSQFIATWATNNNGRCEVNLYLDGFRFGNVSTGTSCTWNQTVASSINIGGSSNANNFTGLMDEIRITDTETPYYEVYTRNQMNSPYADAELLFNATDGGLAYGDTYIAQYCPNNDPTQCVNSSPTSPLTFKTINVNLNTSKPNSTINFTYDTIIANFDKINSTLNGNGYANLVNLSPDRVGIYIQNSNSQPCTANETRDFSNLDFFIFNVTQYTQKPLDITLYGVPPGVSLTASNISNLGAIANCSRDIVQHYWSLCNNGSWSCGANFNQSRYYPFNEVKVSVNYSDMALFLNATMAAIASRTNNIRVGAAQFQLATNSSKTGSVNQLKQTLDAAQNISLATYHDYTSALWTDFNGDGYTFFGSESLIWPSLIYRASSFTYSVLPDQIRKTTGLQIYLHEWNQATDTVNDFAYNTNTKQMSESLWVHSITTMLNNGNISGASYFMAQGRSWAYWNETNSSIINPAYNAAKYVGQLCRANTSLFTYGDNATDVIVCRNTTNYNFIISNNEPIDKNVSLNASSFLVTNVTSLSDGSVSSFSNNVFNLSLAPYKVGYFTVVFNQIDYINGTTSTANCTGSQAPSVIGQWNITYNTSCRDFQINIGQYNITLSSGVQFNFTNLTLIGAGFNFASSSVVNCFNSTVSPSDPQLPFEGGGNMPSSSNATYIGCTLNRYNNSQPPFGGYFRMNDSRLINSSPRIFGSNSGKYELYNDYIECINGNGNCIADFGSAQFLLTYNGITAKGNGLNTFFSSSGIKGQSQFSNINLTNFLDGFRFVQSGTSGAFFSNIRGYNLSNELFNIQQANQNITLQDIACYGNGSQACIRTNGAAGWLDNITEQNVYAFNTSGAAQCYRTSHCYLVNITGDFLNGTGATCAALDQANDSFIQDVYCNTPGRSAVEITESKNVRAQNIWVKAQNASRKPIYTNGYWGFGMEISSYNVTVTGFKSYSLNVGDSEDGCIADHGISFENANSNAAGNPSWQGGNVKVSNISFCMIAQYYAISNAAGQAFSVFNVSNITIDHFNLTFCRGIDTGHCTGGYFRGYLGNNVTQINLTDGVVNNYNQGFIFNNASGYLTNVSWNNVSTNQLRLESNFKIGIINSTPIINYTTNLLNSSITQYSFISFQLNWTNGTPIINTRIDISGFSTELYPDFMPLNLTTDSSGLTGLNIVPFFKENVSGNYTTTPLLANVTYSGVIKSFSFAANQSRTIIFSLSMPSAINTTPTPTNTAINNSLPTFNQKVLLSSWWYDAYGVTKSLFWNNITGNATWLPINYLTAFTTSANITSVVVDASTRWVDDGKAADNNQSSYAYFKCGTSNQYANMTFNYTVNSTAYNYTMNFSFDYYRVFVGTGAYMTTYIYNVTQGAYVAWGEVDQSNINANLTLTALPLDVVNNGIVSIMQSAKYNACPTTAGMVIYDQNLTYVQNYANMSYIVAPAHTSVAWKYYANNSFGNLNETLQQTFTAQNTLPATANITYPPNQTILSIGHLNINWTSTDADGDKLFAFLYQNGSLTASGDSNFSLNLNAGYYYFDVMASDNLSNATANSSRIYVTIDIEPPTPQSYALNNSAPHKNDIIKFDVSWYDIDGLYCYKFYNNMTNTNTTCSVFGNATFSQDLIVPQANSLVTNTTNSSIAWTNSSYINDLDSTTYAFGNCSLNNARTASIYAYYDTIYSTNYGDVKLNYITNRSDNINQIATFYFNRGMNAFVYLEEPLVGYQMNSPTFAYSNAVTPTNSTIVVRFDAVCGSGIGGGSKIFSVNITSAVLAQVNNLSQPLSAISEANLTVTAPKGTFFGKFYANDSQGAMNESLPQLFTIQSSIAINDSINGSNPIVRNQLNFQINLTSLATNYISFNISSPEGFFNKTSLNQTPYIVNFSINVGNFTVGKHNMTYFYADENGAAGNQTIVWYRHDYSIVYNRYVSSLTNQSYFMLLNGTGIDILNLTGFSAFFLFNNTIYTVSNSNISQIYNSSAIILAPQVTLPSENKTFFFNYTLFGFNFTTDSLAQNLTTLSLDNCSANSRVVFNISNFDEESPATPLIYSAQMTFGYWADSRENAINFSGSFEGLSSYRICLNGNQTIFTDAYILYNATNGFTQRWYLQNESIANYTKNVSLYNFQNNVGYSDLQGTIRNVLDFNPLTNTLTQLLRYYVSENKWRIVQEDRSSETGFVRYNVKDKNVDYRLNFIDASNRLIKQTDNLHFDCANAICALDFTLTPIGQGQVNNLSVGWTYNNITKIVNITWNDPTLITSYVRLYITKEAGVSITTICNNITYAPSGSMACNISQYQGDLFLRVYSSASPERPVLLVTLEKLQEILSSIVSKADAGFIAFLLILIFTIAGAYMAGATGAITGVTFAFIIMMALGLFSWLNALTAGAIVVISLVIGAVNRR